MKKSLLSILLGITVIFAACSGGEEEVQQTEDLVKTVNVKTETIATGSFNSFVKVIGLVETSNDIMISAEVSGKVVRYNAQEGEKVRAGQTIIKIDDAKLKQELARLQAATNQAKETYERLKKVYEEDGIGSELDYLNAKYAYEQNSSALESIKVDVANTEIKAPFSGTVEQISYEIGEMVSPGATVVRLIGSDNYKLTAGVPARYANVINAGDEVEIWFDTQDADTMTKAISYVGNSINPQNRTFRIEINLPSQPNLKVDMIANIRLKTLEKQDVIVISEEFIYSKDGKYVAYLSGTNSEGKAVAKEMEVVLGPSYRSNVIVESGLEVGDDLITIGSAFLNNNMRISVVDENQTLAAE